jgi:hypothetical protein
MISLYYGGTTIRMASQDYLLIVYFGYSLVVLGGSNLNLLFAILLNLLSRLKFGVVNLAVLNCSNFEVQACKIHQKGTINERSCSSAVAECYTIVGCFFDALTDFEREFICE